MILNQEVSFKVVGESGRGKRGGSRILYYWYNAQGVILMLFIFKKNEKDDLTKAQLKDLKTIVEKEYR